MQHAEEEVYMYVYRRVYSWTWRLYDTVGTGCRDFKLLHKNMQRYEQNYRINTQKILGAGTNTLGAFCDLFV
jgi:hypothetical protein